MSEDMERFKADYPEVYDKFREMNNALAALQRAAQEPGQQPSSSWRDQPSMILEIE